MASAVKIETTILPGGKVEVSAPELVAGKRATVFIVVEDSASEHATEEPRHIIDLVADLPGHRLFKTAEEVDDYIREERDSWDR